MQTSDNNNSQAGRWEPEQEPTDGFDRYSCIYV